ncbi:hypothetical protein CFK37_12055 [Virgibacillus phasianinus]|uniref:Uncharacterized protein n=1 Tax=Virgibacillus phasianinus TaxID=2017483 RepID=A0A220U3T5_9BACI|nr:hypothetical protein [Virgibacillus phasianinus]ASK62828.1 hypothetical protein CFK37_12055 [Virgibacillus phasianinus]
MYKKLLIFVSIITLISLIAYTQLRLAEIDLVEPSKIYIFQFTLYSFLLAIVLEWNGLKQLFKGKIGINYLIIPCIIGGILTFIPKYQWLHWFGAYLEPEGLRWLGTPFYFEGIHIMIAIISGILLVRSFVKTDAGNE